MSTRNIEAQEKIFPGQNVSIDLHFRDPDTRGLIDPGTVSMIVQKPDDSEVLVEVERQSIGFYRGNFVPDVGGKWKWRAVSAAPGQAAKEGVVVVEKSSFES